MMSAIIHPLADVHAFAIGKIADGSFPVGAHLGATLFPNAAIHKERNTTWM